TAPFDFSNSILFKMSNMSQSQNKRSLQDIQEDLRLYNSLQHFLSQGDASANSAEGLNNDGDNNGDGPVQFANEIDNAGTADPLRAQPAHRDGDDMVGNLVPMCQHRDVNKNEK